MQTLLRQLDLVERGREKDEGFPVTFQISKNNGIVRSFLGGGGEEGTISLQFEVNRCPSQQANLCMAISSLH